MRTTEERARLIHKRTAELKLERQKRSSVDWTRSAWRLACWWWPVSAR